MSAMMTVIYAKQTQHVLAARRRLTPASDTLADLVTSDGLPVAGARSPVLSNPPLFNYGALVKGDERLVVPQSELATASLHLNLDVLRRPFRYVSDGTSAAALPLTAQRLRIVLTTTNVVIGSPVMLPVPGHLSFAAETKVLIQVEGPTPAERRVMRSSFPQGSYAEHSFPLTTDSGMAVPLPASTPKKSYALLVLIEGESADLRTAEL
jgi:hypothetical protein